MNAARNLVESTLIPHTAFRVAMQRIEQALGQGSRSPEPTGIALIGESRTGKSRVLEEADTLLTRMRTPQGAIVPILRIRTPARPTVKGVASLMLKTLGDPKWEKGSEAAMTARLEGLIVDCRTVMVMVDEFQHFFDKGTHKVFYEVSDWLKILMDDTRVTVVVSGLDSCLPVLRQNEQLAGRFLAPVFLPRFNWLDPDDMAEFLGILQAFHEAMALHFDMPDLHGEEMAFRMWCASGGLIGYLAKLLRQTVWDACDAGRRTLSLQDFQAAHASAIWSEFGVEFAAKPFHRSFSVEPTQEKIAQALLVGVHRADEEVRAKPRSTRRSEAVPNSRLSQILTRTGA